jgi:hypothetical protein
MPRRSYSLAMLASCRVPAASDLAPLPFSWRRTADELVRLRSARLRSGIGGYLLYS